MLIFKPDFEKHDGYEWVTIGEREYKFIYGFPYTVLQFNCGGEVRGAYTLKAAFDVHTEPDQFGQYKIDHYFSNIKGIMVKDEHWRNVDELQSAGLQKVLLTIIEIDKTK